MSEPTEREWLEGLRYEDKFPQPQVHVTALTLRQLRACLRALADTAGVYVIDMVNEEDDPPAHLSENEWATVVVLKDVHRRACELEGVSVREGWT